MANSNYIGNSKVSEEPKEVLRLTIVDGAITTPKIADEAVTEEKLSPEVVEKINTQITKIEDNSVTTPKIANGAVTEEKLNSGIMESIASNVLNQIQTLLAPVISKANSSYYYTELLKNTYNVEILDAPPTYTSTNQIRFTKNTGGSDQVFKIHTDESEILEYKEDLKVLSAYLGESYNYVNLEQFSNYGIKEIIVDVACISTYEDDSHVPSTISAKILGKNTTLPIIKPWNNEPIRYATFRVVSVSDEFEGDIPIISDPSYTGGDTPFYIKISVVCAPDEN